MGLAVYGFVFHIIFGKAYALVPAYFDRQLRTPWGPRLQLPLTALGAALIGLGPAMEATFDVARAGTVLWGLGAAVFVVTLVGTIGRNILGADTGTGRANSHRRRVDRFANGFVPVALAYFAVGTYETAARVLWFQPVLDGAPPRASHLLAVGTATLLVFAIGARLLPRFFVAEPPVALVRTMLVAGAIAPAILAVGFGRSSTLQVGGLVLLVGMACYAGVVVALVRRTDRRRIGLAGVLLGALGGLFGVSVGLYMAFAGQTAVLVAVHVRIVTLGFLGITIVGVLFQFYPPNIGTLPAISDRWAASSIGLFATGLALEVAGTVVSFPMMIVTGRGSALVAALGAAWILVGLTIERGA